MRKFCKGDVWLFTGAGKVNQEFLCTLCSRQGAFRSCLDLPARRQSQGIPCKNRHARGLPSRYGGQNLEYKAASPNRSDRSAHAQHDRVPSSWTSIYHEYSHQLSAVFGTLVLSQVFENGHTRHSVRLSASTAWGEHGCQAGLAATRTKHDKHIMAR